MKILIILGSKLKIEIFFVFKIDEPVKSPILAFFQSYHTEIIGSEFAIFDFLRDHQKFIT